MKFSQFDDYTGSYPRGLAWMRFYIFVRFPLSIVLMGLQFAVNAAGCEWRHPDFLSLYSLFLDGLMLLFTGIVYFKMKSLRLVGYAFNIALLVMEAVTKGFGFAFMRLSIYSDLRYHLLLFALLTSLLFLFWVLPNLLYFRKRRGLFADPVPGEPSPPAPMCEDDEPVPFAPAVYPPVGAALRGQNAQSAAVRNICIERPAPAGGDNDPQPPAPRRRATPVAGTAAAVLAAFVILFGILLIAFLKELLPLLRHAARQRESAAYAYWSRQADDLW